jgi:uncharacterized membrane protein
MPGKTRDRSGSDSGGGTSTEGQLTVEQMASPESLKTYEEVAPGSASQVMETFIAENTHRRELELRRQRSTQRRDYFGLVTVTIVALAVFGVSAWLIDYGHAIPGTIFGVLGIVGAFLMLILRRART